MTTPSSPQSWPPGRILTLVLIPAFLGLASDLRIEHVEVVSMDSVAWIPIIYSLIMAMVCLLAVLLWRRAARLALLPLFLAALIVGGLGMYKHNRHHPDRILSDSTRAWTDPAMKHPDAPPHTAPLAFAALGLLGVLATLKRFN